MDVLKYDITLLMLFCLVGVIVKLFIGQSHSSDGSYGPASASIWGYGVVALSVLSLIMITFTLASKMLPKDTNPENWGIAKILIINSLPGLLLFGVLTWLITLNATYYKQINEGHVATEYAQFSTMSTIMVILQILALFKYLMDDYKISQGGPTNTSDLRVALKSQMSAISYLLTILNIVFIGMMNIVVEFFSTDG
jgi:hypothetical protein